MPLQKVFSRLTELNDIMFLPLRVTPHSNSSLSESLHCFPPARACVLRSHYYRSMLLEHGRFLGTVVITYVCSGCYVLHALVLGPLKHIHTYEGIQMTVHDDR